LTKRAVEALEKPDKGQSFLWDGEIRGFGVRVVPSGLKTFVVQYRNAEGKSRRIKIARFGVKTVEEARELAKIKLGRVADGIDPAEEPEAGKDDITVEALCDWYLTEAEAGRILGRKNRPIKASTLAMDRSRIKTHIKPLLGKRLVGRIATCRIILERFFPGSPRQWGWTLVHPPGRSAKGGGRPRLRGFSRFHARRTSGKTRILAAIISATFDAHLHASS
jgi:hypothetical protein